MKWWLVAGIVMLVRYDLNRYDGIIPRMRVIRRGRISEKLFELGRLFDLLDCSACVFLLDCSA